MIAGIVAGRLYNRSNEPTTTTIAGPDGAALTDIAWSAELGLFCITVQNSASEIVSLTSPDGINWTNHIQETGFNSLGSTLAYGGPLNTRFVRYALDNGNGDPIVAYSTDGALWNYALNPGISGISKHTANGLFLTRTGVSHSSNGVSWSSNIVISPSPAALPECAVDGAGTIVALRGGSPYLFRNVLDTEWTNNFGDHGGAPVPTLFSANSTINTSVFTLPSLVFLGRDNIDPFSGNPAWAIGSWNTSTDPELEEPYINWTSSSIIIPDVTNLYDIVERNRSSGFGSQLYALSNRGIAQLFPAEGFGVTPYVPVSSAYTGLCYSSELDKLVAITNNMIYCVDFHFN